MRGPKSARRLCSDFRNHARANRTATFADRKAQALFHR
ncbi:MAG: hypothetical protein ACI9KK_001722, partial [Ascidiaceihabitans sp.]